MVCLIQLLSAAGRNLCTSFRPRKATEAQIAPVVTPGWSELQQAQALQLGWLAAEACLTSVHQVSAWCLQENESATKVKSCFSLPSAPRRPNLARPPFTNRFRHIAQRSKIVRGCRGKQVAQIRGIAYDKPSLRDVYE